MIFTNKFSDPNEAFDIIINAVKKFNPDVFLYALQYKNWDEYEITQMSQELTIYRHRLEIGYNSLVKFSRDFNKQFVTTNNKCFESALKMLRILRSGIKETKKIYQRFSPRSKREEFHYVLGAMPLSVYDHSYISAKNYQYDFFKFQCYPDCVNGLCTEMSKFFALLLTSMQLCKQVMEEEQQIRSDHKYCHFLFQSFKKGVLNEIEGIPQLLIPSSSSFFTPKENPAIASWMKYSDDYAWAPDGFHNYSIIQVRCLVIMEAKEKEKKENISLTEQKLYGDDVKKALAFRSIIQHFDEIVPEKTNKKLPAKYVCMLEVFAGLDDIPQSQFVAYFNDIYTKGPHRFETVTYAAVNNAKKRFLRDDSEYLEFAKKIKEHFGISMSSKTSDASRVS